MLRITPLLLLIAIYLLAACSTNKGQAVPALPTAAPLQKNTATVRLAVVTSPKANLRSKPTRQAKAVATVAKGDQVVIISGLQLGHGIEYEVARLTKAGYMAIPSRLLKRPSFSATANGRLTSHVRKVSPALNHRMPFALKPHRRNS